MKRLFAVIIASFLVSSCTSNSGQVIELRGKDSREQRAAESVPAKPVTNTDITGNVLPHIIGASIESNGAQTWLQVDADAEIVWRKLSEFWAQEDVTLSMQNPQAGLMETDWHYLERKTNASGGTVLNNIASGLLANMRRTALDKFIVRLQRAGDDTRVFITHRRREKISKEPENNRDTVIFEWVERETDAERVAQLLQMLVLIFGGAHLSDEPA